jgi:peroxiredoxin
MAIEYDYRSRLLLAKFNEFVIPSVDTARSAYRIDVDPVIYPGALLAIVEHLAAPEVRGTWLVSIASALLCVLGVAGSAPHALAADVQSQRWTTGRQPMFTLPNTSGADVSLDSRHGQIVVVHFFATWCEPCREELPALNLFATRANGTVKVLVISIDSSVRRFIEATPVDYPVLLDRDRVVAKAWKVSTLRTTFVLDADLRPRLVTETEFAWDKVDPGKFADIVTWAPVEQMTTEIPNKPSYSGGR